jgi:hypothetical protein
VAAMTPATFLNSMMISPAGSRRSESALARKLSPAITFRDIRENIALFGKCQGVFLCFRLIFRMSGSNNRFGNIAPGLERSTSVVSRASGIGDSARGL